MHDLQSFPKEKNVPGQKPTMDKEIFDTDGFSLNLGWNGILFPKLFWPSVRKKCFDFWNSRLKVENLQKVLRSLKKFIQTVKGQNNFLNRMPF